MRSVAFVLAVGMCVGACQLITPNMQQMMTGVSGKSVGEMCTQPTDCRAGLGCTAGVCTPRHSGIMGSSCELTADCGTGLYCSTARTCQMGGTGASGASCQSAADCRVGLICFAFGFGGVCQAPTPGTGDIGAQCMTNNQCLPGLSCAPSMLSSNGYACGSVPPSTTNIPSIPFWAGETCGTDTGPATAYFTVPGASSATTDFYRLPFPNDIRRTSTGIDLSGHPHPGTVLSSADLPIDIVNEYLRASEHDLQGFATNPLVYFRFSAPYDWSKVSTSIELVDITPDSPNYGQPSGLSFQTTDGSVTKYICPNWLAFRTPHGAPLRGKTTYAAIVKPSLTPKSGASAFAVPADFATLMSATEPSTSNTVMHNAWAAYAPLRACIADSTHCHVQASDVLVAAVFTTQDPEALPRGLHDKAYAQSLPALSDMAVCGSGTASPCDDGTPERSCSPTDPNFTEIHGKIEVPIFQSGTAPYLTQADGGDIMLDGTGAPVFVRTEKICFGLTIPKNAAMPTGGWPVLLHTYGTGGSFTDAVTGGLAADVSSGSDVTAPAATFTFELPQHGARRNGNTQAPSNLFFNFANPGAARGNVLQGAADIASVMHFLTMGSIDMMHSPTSTAISFDPTKIVLFAHSQGSTHAALEVPYDNNFAAVVFSGLGGDLVQSLLHKTNPVNIAEVFPFAVLDPDGQGKLAGGEYHPLLGLFQSYFETADPVNFARRIQREPIAMWPGTSVFMTYGKGDTYSPEETMQAYAEAANFSVVTPVIVNFGGLTQVAPPLMSNATIGSAMRTIGMRQYMPNTGDDGHFVSTNTTAGRADLRAFIRAALAGMSPAIGE